jgi:hypothetical protein
MGTSFLFPISLEGEAKPIYKLKLLDAKNNYKMDCFIL